MQPLDFETFLLIAGGHTAFQLLWAGVELGVFDLLAERGPLTGGAIGEALGLEPQPTRILLMGLTALGLLERRGDRFENGPLAAQQLVRSAPGNVVDVLGWQARIVYPGELDFVESLRANRNVGLGRFPGSGATLYERLRADPELEAVFHKAMSALSRTANAALVAHLDLSQVRHLVDAGGGDGTNAIALAERHPHLRVTVFDNASVCALAEEKIRAAGLEERVDTHVGDFFSSPFPEGADAILFAHILTIWSPEENLALLRRTHDALPPGGRVVVFNMMAHDTYDGPLTAALGSPYFLAIATGKGMLYAWRDYEDWMRRAGFQRTERHELPRDHGVIVGSK